MENIVNKLKELGNYMYTVNEDKEKEYLIKAILFNDDLNYLVFLIKMFRPEDENENQIVVENEIEVIKRSQVNEFINTFGLLNNQEVKIKLNEYLNQLLEFKKSL